MTLEDFFTLTEMKDGLTAPARVRELVAVMQREKDGLVKNVGDATRHWAAVASTIAATENKECLDLFIQLDGLRFIDRWLKDAQTFVNEASDCFVEEALSALLQAVEKLQVYNERLVSSGICFTVRSLLSYKSSKVQDKARALFNNWKSMDDDTKSIDVTKKELLDDKEQNGEHPVSQSKASDASPAGTPVTPKLGGAENETINISNDEGCSQIPPVSANTEDGCHDVGACSASPVKLTSVVEDIGTSKMICHSAENMDPELPAASNQGTAEPIPENSKSEHAFEEARHRNNLESSVEIVCKTEIPASSAVASDGRDGSCRVDAKADEEVIVKPDAPACDGSGELLVKTTSFYDTKLPLNESTNNVDDGKCLERKDPDLGDGSALEETKDQMTTTSNIEEFDKDEKLMRRRRKSKKKRFGKSSKFARLAKNSKSSDIVEQTADMGLEDGTFDALEVARLVAKEVEREVGDYDEQSGSSASSSSSSSSYSSSMSSSCHSAGGIGQPDIPDSKIGEQEMEIDGPAKKLQEMENVSFEASNNEPPNLSANMETNLENHMQDMESSQVTDTVRKPESNTDKGFFEFDLNQEFSSEDLDHLPVDSISNSISVVSASRAAMAPVMPAGPLKFEGSLGWKGSAATSAFRPASPRRVSDGDRALSGAGTSSGSRQRQDFLDIDLNVAEGGDDKIVCHMFGNQKKVVPGLPSGESSVELSPRRSERLKFDLNQTEEHGGTLASEWKLGGRMLGPQRCRRSPSPASSSSCLQPCTRNFDLNDNPSSYNDPSVMHPFLGESPANKGNPFVGQQDDSVISILGTKVKKSVFPPQHPSSFLNGRTSEPVMDTGLLRGPVMGLGPAVPYAQSAYGYNGLAVGPGVPFSSASIYGSPGPIPYMFDSRGAPFMPPMVGPASAGPPSYCQPSLVMNMMGAPASNLAGSFRGPSLDMNSGYAVEAGNRDPAVLRQFFIPGQGRPLDDHLRDSLRPLSSGASGGKRKEPDSGWELYPTNYRHHQPPH